MDKKIKKKRRSPIRQFPKIAVLGIVVAYFLFRVFPVMGTTNQNTAVIAYGKIEKTIVSTGLVAREEITLAKIQGGESRLFMIEGEKVAKGQKLAEIYGETLNEEDQKSLEALNLRIESIQQKNETGSLFQTDIEKIDAEIAGVMQKIQQEIQANQYAKAEAYEKELQKLVDKKDAIIGQDSFSGKNLAQLEEQKSMLESSLNASLDQVYSPGAGYVSYWIDGYETLVSPKTVTQFSGEDLQAILTEYDPEEKQVQGVKLIKTHVWSILLQLTHEEAEGIEAGKRIKIRLKDQPREYDALVSSVVEEETGTMLVLDLTEAIEEISNERMILLDIVKDRYEGAVVPNESLVLRDEVEGVYRVDVNGFVRFIPVQVKGKDENNTILTYGSFNGTDPETGEPKIYSTINLYDEIVLKGNEVEEGQKIR